MRAMLSGGAPLSPSTHEYLRAVLGVDLLQVIVHEWPFSHKTVGRCVDESALNSRSDDFNSTNQGYGLTETCACGSITHFEEMSAGTVGPPVQAVSLTSNKWQSVLEL